MNKEEFDAVLKLPAAKRYEYFIKKVADIELIWGLYSEGWATSADEFGNIAVPFWPKSEFADLCAKDNWAGYIAKSIELEDFLTKWLLGMKKDGYRPSVFPTNTEAVLVDIDKLLRDLNEELEKYN